MAAIMHEHGGYCFVDFAAAAPYVDMNMHPDDPAQALDAIFFSPHKFLGGPGTSGVLVFDGVSINATCPMNRVAGPSTGRTLGEDTGSCIPWKPGRRRHTRFPAVDQGRACASA